MRRHLEWRSCSHGLGGNSKGRASLWTPEMGKLMLFLLMFHPIFKTEMKSGGTVEKTPCINLVSPLLMSSSIFTWERVLHGLCCLKMRTITINICTLIVRHVSITSGLQTQNSDAKRWSVISYPIKIPPQHRIKR